MHATSNHPVESAHERHHSSQSKLFTYAFDKTCTAPALLPVRWCQNHVQNQVQSFLLPWGMAMCTSACPVDVGHIQDAGNVRGALGSTNPKNVEIYLVSKFVLPALPLHVPSVDRQSRVPSPSPPPHSGGLPSHLPWRRPLTAEQKGSRMSQQGNGYQTRTHPP